MAVAEGVLDADLTTDWLFIGGQIEMCEGRLNDARNMIDRAMVNYAAGPMLGYCLVNLGVIARERGDYLEAQSLLNRGLESAERFGDMTLVAHALEGFACLAAAEAEHERAMCLAGVAAALREAIGAPIPPTWSRLLTPWLEVSRATLGNAPAAAAWHTGQALPLQQALAHARARSAPSFQVRPQQFLAVGVGAPNPGKTNPFRSCSHPANWRSCVAWWPDAPTVESPRT